MFVLGLNGNFSDEDIDLVPDMPMLYFHDAAACLVRDGELVAAVEEERLNRIKKTNKFPVNAIRACLARANVEPRDIDAVAYFFPESHADLALNELYVDNSEVPTRYTRELIRAKLRTGLDWDLPEDKLFYTPHHLAHARSTLVRSGMSEALVVVMDGMGEESSGTVYRADGEGRLECLATYPITNSLGLFYLNATQQLGYRLGDEYKVMGLAPYGDPDTFRGIFESLYTLKEKGNYELAPGLFGRIVSPAFFVHDVPPRRKGQEFTQQHKDLAAGVQDALERIVLHVLEYWARHTGLRALCFGGGVAHNCSLNGQILRSGLFDEVFVHPASYDAGAAEGAALEAEYRLRGPRPRLPRLRSASFGPALGTDRQIAEKLRGWESLIEVERPADIVEQAAALLAAGAVLGWAQGGSEFGPRALGHRSILADPRPKENQTRINAMVKKRESFRPFAPVATPESAPVYFELSDAAANFDFMSFVVRVREDKHAELGAVTHVDGTARLQIVDPEANERFHRLVVKFGELTGTPVLLNTSFNNNAEPIVQSVDDALACFLTTDLDYLVVEDFLVRRRPGGSFDDFVPHFRPVTRLTRSTRSTIRGERLVTRVVRLEHPGGPHVEVSERLFSVLEAVDGKTSLRQLAAGAGGLTDEMRTELHRLWQGRCVVLAPAER